MEKNKFRYRAASPVGPLDVVRRGHLLHSQHMVEGLAGGGQGALPLLLRHDASRPAGWPGETQKGAT